MRKILIGSLAETLTYNGRAQHKCKISPKRRSAKRFPLDSCCPRFTEDYERHFSARSLVLYHRITEWQSGVIEHFKDGALCMMVPFPVLNNSAFVPLECTNEPGWFVVF